MKDNPSKVSNTFLASEIWSLFCARHRLLRPQASSDRWRVRKYLARSYLAVLRFVKIVHGKDYMLFVCSLRSLPSSQQIQTAQPHPHCSLRHKEGADAGSTSSSAVSLRTTNDLESRGAQAFATTTDWQSNGVSNRRSTRRLETGDFLGHAQEFRVAESCAKRPTASRWWTRRSLKWCMTKLGKFSLQVTMVLWTLFRTRLTTIHLFQNRKIAQ